MWHQTIARFCHIIMQQMSRKRCPVHTVRTTSFLELTSCTRGCSSRECCSGSCSSFVAASAICCFSSSLLSCSCWNA